MRLWLRRPTSTGMSSLWVADMVKTSVHVSKRERRGSSSSFVPRLDRCLEPVEIHVFQVRAAQFFSVSFVESVETNGVEDLPEWSAVTKNPDKRSFGSGAVYPERNGHETLPLGLSCSKILSRLLRSPRPCAVSCRRKS